MDHLFEFVFGFNTGVLLFRLVVIFRLWCRRTVGCREYNIRLRYSRMTVNTLVIFLSSGYCVYLFTMGAIISQKVIIGCGWIPGLILLLSVSEGWLRRRWLNMYCKSYRFRDDSFRFFPEYSAEQNTEKYLYGDVIINHERIVRGVIRNSKEIRKQLRMMKKLEVCFRKGHFYARCQKPQKVEFVKPDNK